MKTISKSIKITLAFCLVLGLFYVGFLWLFAKLAGPGNGNVETVTLNGQIVGAKNVGQKFTRDIYFWGRPSAADYAADASAGSNMGPTNEAYLKEVEARIDSFLVSHPYLERSEVPAEMVTASGSGLDPHITPESAYAQVGRVAAARNIEEAEVRAIVEENIEKPLLGLFGPAKVNVPELNVALEEAGQPEK